MKTMMTELQPLNKIVTNIHLSKQANKVFNFKGVYKCMFINIHLNGSFIYNLSRKNLHIQETISSNI